VEVGVVFPLGDDYTTELPNGEPDLIWLPVFWVLSIVAFAVSYRLAA
jgi:hypothetical protein